jgi:hypothetical protein
MSVDVALKTMKSAVMSAIYTENLLMTHVERCVMVLSNSRDNLR